MVLLGFFVTGCATITPGAGELPARTLTGHLLTVEKANWFMPCGDAPGAPRLWVTFTDESVRQIETARSRGVAVADDTVFVRWQAAATDQRLVGPGGPALLVRRIIEVRPAGAGDCGHSR